VVFLQLSELVMLIYYSYNHTVTIVLHSQYSLGSIVLKVPLYSLVFLRMQLDLMDIYHSSSAQSAGTNRIIPYPLGRD